MGAIEKIRAQQANLEEGTPAWVVGEQLAELCAAEPESERLVDADLENDGMSLIEAEKKIKAWADAHKRGNFAYVSPQKAEEILREFYGLAAASPAGQREQPKQAGKPLNLLDFM